jgi:hypothetical protein
MNGISILIKGLKEVACPWTICRYSKKVPPLDQEKGPH